jgi:hypothetical protein
MRYRIKLIDNEGRVVASTVKEAEGITIQDLKTVENAQNFALREVGFQGHCELEPDREGQTPL